MAEAKAKKTEEAAVDTSSNEYWAERVPYKAFKAPGKYMNDITVIVHGKAWKIQRGVEVMIPRFVLEVIKESEAQDEATAEMIEAEADNFYEMASKGRI